MAPACKYTHRGVLTRDVHRMVSWFDPQVTRGKGRAVRSRTRYSVWEKEEFLEKLFVLREIYNLMNSGAEAEVRLCLLTECSFAHDARLPCMTIPTDQFECWLIYRRLRTCRTR